MKKLYAVAVMAVLLCLACLVMSGTVFAVDTCVDNRDGTVADNFLPHQTGASPGLMWQKATAGPMNWDAATSYASSLSLGGHSDWRLPSEYELRGLRESPCKSLMDVVFSSYWSSTPSPVNTNAAWLVNFNGPYVYVSNKSNSYYVRAVRD